MFDALPRFLEFADIDEEYLRGKATKIREQIFIEY